MKADEKVVMVLTTYAFKHNQLYLTVNWETEGVQYRTTNKPSKSDLEMQKMCEVQWMGGF